MEFTKILSARVFSGNVSCIISNINSNLCFIINIFVMINLCFVFAKKCIKVYANI